ncbi:MAG: alpha/beta hydrolase [Parvularculales bacterium]
MTDMLKTDMNNTAVPGQKHFQPPEWFTDAINTPCEIRNIEVSGCSIEYLLWGSPDKRGLLLVHGNGAHARWWSFIAPFLAQDFCVAAMNLSGMGDSGWRGAYDIETYTQEQMEVCQDAGFFNHKTPPVIVGHSFGGFITILTSALYGERLAGTVIVDSPINPPGREHKRPRRLIRPNRVYPTVEAAMGRFRLAPEQPCENGFLLNYIARHSVRAAQDDNGEHTGWGWKFDPDVYRRFSIGDMSDRLRNARCRIAIVRGDKSVLMPLDVANYMFDLLGRKAPVIGIPEARHHVMLDQPLAFVSALRTLLAEWDYSLSVREF